MLPAGHTLSSLTSITFKTAQYSQCLTAADIRSITGSCPALQELQAQVDQQHLTALSSLGSLRSLDVRIHQPDAVAALVSMSSLWRLFLNVEALVDPVEVSGQQSAGAGSSAQGPEDSDSQWQRVQQVLMALTSLQQLTQLHVCGRHDLFDAIPTQLRSKLAVGFSRGCLKFNNQVRPLLCWTVSTTAFGVPPPPEHKALNSTADAT